MLLVGYLGHQIYHNFINDEHNRTNRACLKCCLQYHKFGSQDFQMISVNLGNVEYEC